MYIGPAFAGAGPIRQHPAGSLGLACALGGPGFDQDTKLVTVSEGEDLPRPAGFLQVCGCTRKKMLTPRPEPELGYVGAGHGGFVAETSYKFVGCGAGEFDFVTTDTPGFLGHPWVLIGLGAMSVLLIVVALLLIISTIVSHTDTQTPVPRMNTPYNCSSSVANFQSDWSTEKKVWCCANEGRACNLAGEVPPLPLPKSPTVPEEQYDCNDGLSNWEASWTPRKKRHCCESIGRGCPIV